MSQPIGFGIIGYGNIGKRHAHHIVAHQEAELKVVVDLNPEKSDELDNAIQFSTDIKLLCEHPEIEVVSVCTPNFLHQDHCIQLMKSGKHVICEKPMAMSVKECDAMIATAQVTNRLIFAVKQNRYNPPVQQVKKLITNNGLGKIFLINVNCFWNRGDSYYADSNWRGKKQKDGGCLFTQFSHFVDILYYLNGPVREVKGDVHNFAHTHNTEFEDSGVFVMTAENGALINFNFSTTAFAKNMEGAITILAEKGAVKIGGQYLNTLEYQNIKDLSLPQINIEAKANDYGLYQGSMSNHDRVINNVVNVLRKGEAIMTSAEEGREVVKIIEQMYASVSR